MRHVMLALAAFGPASVEAEDDPELALYGPVLFSCYESAQDGETRSACMGALSEACRAAEEGGETTLGIVGCALAEARGWDRLLNEEYRAARAFARASDVSTAEFFPDFANLEESLLQAQRAWVAFRDAECGLAYAYWGSGSMRNIAASDCQMTMTAERTIELRDFLGPP